MHTFWQIIRYSIVGIVLNTICYVLYVFFTWLGFEPKLVALILYLFGMLLSFWGNKIFTFDYHGSSARIGWRFFVIHIIACSINILLLWVMVDKLEYPHQWVQLASIAISAIFLFVCCKVFVFEK